jgi:Ni/Co efflux regulator RcnB
MEAVTHPCEGTMKMNKMLAAVMTSFLAFGVATPVLAAGDRGHGPRHGWDDRRPGHHQDRRHADRGRDWRDDRRHHDRGHHDRRPVVVHHAPPPRVVYRPAPRPAWVRGHRYHDYYRGPVYVVNDYNHYHLRRPPHGHHWIRSDRGDMLLVAVATGVIADIILHH